jgi:hypothetical protein
MPAGRSRKAPRWRAHRWALALAAVLAVAWAPGAQAVVTAYDWSGTLSVARTGSGPVSGFHVAYSGPVGPSSWRGIPSFTPTMTASSGWFQRPEEWCRSTSELRPGDVADLSVPIYVEPGRPGADGVPGPPRIVPPAGGAWSFPQHAESCLAFSDGMLQRIPDERDGLTNLEDTFSCTADQYPYPAPEGLPYAVSSYLPPALPQPQVLPDGRVRIVGTVQSSCDFRSIDETSSVLTVTVDLTGTPVSDDPGPSIIGVDHALQVEVRGTQYGSVVGLDGAIACGQGGAACGATLAGGATVRLAALQATAGRLLFWTGCDQVWGQSCTVTMSTPRTVQAWFGYDFLGQWEPPPDGLFDPARKAEIAANGASSARNGAVGCGLTAALLATGGSGGVIIAGAAGAATRWSALVEKALEETVGNCATGLAGTIFNGVLLKVDPPDPAWRTLALAEPFGRRVVTACPQRGCAALTRAARALVAADARILELQEAIAVAANRYGNAVTSGDAAAQGLHQATMRAASGLLAGASLRRNRAAAALAKAFRAVGVRRITTPRSVAARALSAQAAGRGVPQAVVSRLLRRHLIARRAELPALLKAAAPRRAAAVDWLAALERPAPTAQMRSAAAKLTLGDVGRLLHAVHRDTGTAPDVAARQIEQLALAMRCDAGSPAALRSLASLALDRRVRREAGLLVATAAREVAMHDLRTDEACRG